ncbi:hypothetical protein QOZ80_6BG0461280 [Eleusine coracana subsp. coracana]|nr:hypothetical protein QOZ80_6BG0461280 [Eleusine coracana subsp. coracana]
MNFIFIEPTPSTQVHDVEAQEETENDPSWNVHGVDNSDEDKVIIMDQTHTGDVGTSSRVRSVGDLTNKRANSSIVLTDKEKNGGQKRKKDDRVADMMKRYLELKTKQVEEETAELRRVTTNVDAEQERPRINAPMDFSITSCVVVVNTIQEFLNDEKIDSFDVSKNPQNREIFMAAESTTRVLWRKKKLRLINSSS